MEDNQTEIVKPIALAMPAIDLATTADIINAKAFEYGQLKQITNKKEYDAVHDARMDCVRMRTAISNRHAELKAPYLEWAKKLDEEKRRLIGLVEEIEAPLKALESAADKEKEERRAKEAKEAADRINGMANRLSSVGAPIDLALLNKITDEEFEELYAPLKAKKDQEDAIRAEQEAAAAESARRVAAWAADLMAAGAVFEPKELTDMSVFEFQKRLEDALSLKAQREADEAARKAAEKEKAERLKNRRNFLLTFKGYEAANRADIADMSEHDFEALLASTKSDYEAAQERERKLEQERKEERERLAKLQAEKEEADRLARQKAEQEEAQRAEEERKRREEELAPDREKVRVYAVKLAVAARGFGLIKDTDLRNSVRSLAARMHKAAADLSGMSEFELHRAADLEEQSEGKNKLPKEGQS